MGEQQTETTNGDGAMPSLPPSTPASDAPADSPANNQADDLDTLLSEFDTATKSADAVDQVLGDSQGHDKNQQAGSDLDDLIAQEFGPSQREQELQGLVQQYQQQERFAADKADFDKYAAEIQNALDDAPPDWAENQLIAFQATNPDAKLIFDNRNVPKDQIQREMAEAQRRFNLCHGMRQDDPRKGEAMAYAAELKTYYENLNKVLNSDRYFATLKHRLVDQWRKYSKSRIDLAASDDRAMVAQAVKNGATSREPIEPPAPDVHRMSAREFSEYRRSLGLRP